MKKFLCLLLLLAVLLSWCACAAGQASDGYSYEYYDNGSIKTKRFTDPETRIRDYWTYTADGEPSYYLETAANGATLLKISYDHYGDSPLKHETQYTDEGKPREYRIYEDGILTYLEDYHPNGETASATYYYAGGTPRERTVLREDGTMLEQKAFYENGNCKLWAEYDEVENFLTVTAYYESGAAQQLERYEDGLRTSTSIYFESGKLQTYQLYEGEVLLMSITYDEEGNILETYLPKE